MPGKERTVNPLMESLILPGETEKTFPALTVTGNGWVKHSVWDQTYGRGQEGVKQFNEIVNGALANFWQTSGWRYPLAIKYNANMTSKEDLSAKRHSGYRTSIGISHIHSVWGDFSIDLSHRKNSYRDEAHTVSITVFVPKLAAFWATKGDPHQVGKNHWTWYDTRETHIGLFNKTVEVKEFNGQKLLDVAKEYFEKVATEIPDLYNIFVDMKFIEILENIEDYLPNNPNKKEAPVDVLIVSEGMSVALAANTRTSHLQHHIEGLQKLAEVLSYIGVDMTIDTTNDGGVTLVKSITFTGQDPQQDLPHKLHFDLSTGIRINCGYVNDEESWLHQKKRYMAQELSALEDI